ncbi:hypothetical protein Tco_0486053 [Tanacetum coccineum]
MYYPRFTKVIVDYFMAKDPSISRRNKMFWHNARDDSMFTTISVVSKTKDEQMEIILKRSKTQQHNSHVSGSGADEGTGVTPRVPDAPSYDFDDEKIS